MNPEQIARRKFLARVGKGMIVATVGTSVAEDLGISTAAAAETEPQRRLTFGNVEPLVSLLQETPVDKLQPELVKRLNDGSVDLRQLIQAAALSNARSFGGEDYIGMHTLMALKPAYLMAQQLPSDRRALVILKVLHRNTQQIQANGGVKNEKLHPVPNGEGGDAIDGAEELRAAVHGIKSPAAEQILSKLVDRSPDAAYNALLRVVADNTDVHRVVFAHRSWDTLDLVGIEHANTLLRQSLRYCLKNEPYASKHQQVRTLLPQLLEEHQLLGREFGTGQAEGAWIEEMSQTIFASSPAQAAAAVAAALADGVSPDALGEAISLAANQLVLRDSGRTERDVRPDKPIGSVHGDSIGVHASDSANAWRHMAKVSSPRNGFACLILGAYQVAKDRTDRGGDFLGWKPRPFEAQLEKIKTDDPKRLVGQLDGAIREKDQATACALVHRYGELGHDSRAVLDLMLQHATSEDGALHAEKYFLTTSSDFAATRPAFRWRHLTGLARVTASEYGKRSAGYAQACELLGVEA